MVLAFIFLSLNAYSPSTIIKYLPRVLGVRNIGRKKTQPALKEVAVSRDTHNRNSSTPGRWLLPPQGILFAVSLGHWFQPHLHGGSFTLKETGEDAVRC